MNKSEGFLSSLAASGRGNVFRPWGFYNCAARLPVNGRARRTFLIQRR
ncbi:MAG TPA: hypothetical protein VF791_22140 [Pyrinomonadaceae bacterium]